MHHLTRRQLLISVGGMASASFLRPVQSLAFAFDVDQYSTVWDVTPLYADSAAWEADRLAVLKHIPLLADLKGSFHLGGTAIAAAYQQASDLSRTTQRVVTYAQLSADVDLDDSEKQERRRQALALQDQLAEATAWMDPTVLVVGQPKLDSFLATTPALTPFRFHFTDLFRQASHTLSAEGEAILAAAQLPMGAPVNIDRLLTGPELPQRAVVLSDGKPYIPGEKPLSTLSREDRKTAYDSSYARYAALQETLGANLSASLQGDAFRAKARHFNSSLDEALFQANIPKAVYLTLISETDRALPVLHRYYQLQQKATKVSPAHLYDLVVPLATTDRAFSVPEMFTITLEAMSPLGENYVSQMRKAFVGKWMDGLPRPGKMKGSLTSAAAYDVHPYLLLNLDTKYESLTLFAHEWGHAIHNTLARESQTFETYYAPVFLQEIGSTCNEQLLISHLIGTAKTKAEKRFFLYQQMRIFATAFFQNALAAEFEATIHERSESGSSLSGGDFSKIYLDLMSRYYGPSVAIDPLYGIRWAQNPQFFSPFYQFQYCTSLTAAVHFSQAILNGGAADRNLYLSVLKAGGSDYGFSVLNAAGLDLSIEGPYRMLVDLFTNVMNEFERLDET